MRSRKRCSGREVEESENLDKSDKVGRMMVKSLESKQSVKQRQLTQINVTLPDAAVIQGKWSHFFLSRSSNHLAFIGT